MCWSSRPAIEGILAGLALAVGLADAAATEPLHGMTFTIGEGPQQAPKAPSFSTRDEKEEEWGNQRLGMYPSAFQQRSVKCPKMASDGETKDTQAKGFTDVQLYHACLNNVPIISTEDSG